MNKKNNRKSWVLWLVAILAVALIAGIFVVKSQTPEVSSVAVIGGADGPTSIYVTQSNHIGGGIFKLIGYVAAGLTVFFLLQYKQKQKKHLFLWLGIGLLVWAAVSLVSNILVVAFMVDIKTAPSQVLLLQIGGVLINPVMWVCLVVGIISLRRYKRDAREQK